MKKLKIFLLLSLLLCFGFVLSPEVHAQGDGPKVFEVDDILPATTQLRISFPSLVLNEFDAFDTNVVYSNFPIIEKREGMFFDFYINNVLIAQGDWQTTNFTYQGSYGTDKYIDIDTSNWDLTKRTITSIGPGSYITGSRPFPFYWEDLAPTPSGYTITFETNGGSTIPDIEEVTELPISLPIPTKENHTFLGWYYNSAFTQIANAGDIIESNVTLYAKWELNAYKAFEIGDVLPAGYIKISWDFTGKPIPEDPEDFVVSSSGDLFIEIFYGYSNIQIDINYEEFYADTSGYTIISLTEPCEITDVGGTSDYNIYIGDALVWEVVSPEYLGDYDDLYDGELLDIEENYILPQSKVGIKLLYNNTGGPKSGTITYTFGTYGQIILTAQEDNSSTQVTSAEITYNFTNPNWNIYMIDDSLANQSFGSTRGILFAGVLLDFTWATEEERTITDINVEGDLELDIIFTRILTEEELAYQEGYSNGYTTAREIFGWKDGDDWYNGIDAWNLGEKYARELYGYYDPTTGEWLSVSDYVARYGTGNGTGPLGPSDFYNNFDKYFIPAMIIVFGGAIVLTILKVFKGRE